MHHLKLDETDNIWGNVNEPLQTDFETDPEKLTEKDLLLEIKRVTSSREEQESKIVDYFSSCKEIAKIQGSKKKISQERTFGSKSLSPKKTKQIDKQKPSKIMQPNFC